jgi:hypothetical protein
MYYHIYKRYYNMYVSCLLSVHIYRCVRMCMRIHPCTNILSQVHMSVNNVFCICMSIFISLFLYTCALWEGGGGEDCGTGRGGLWEARGGGAGRGEWLCVSNQPHQQRNPGRSQACTDYRYTWNTIGTHKSDRSWNLQAACVVSKCYEVRWEPA